MAPLRGKLGSAPSPIAAFACQSQVFGLKVAADCARKRGWSRGCLKDKHNVRSSLNHTRGLGNTDGYPDVGAYVCYKPLRNAVGVLAAIDRRHIHMWWHRKFYCRRLSLADEFVCGNRISRHRCLPPNGQQDLTSCWCNRCSGWWVCRFRVRVWDVRPRQLATEDYVLQSSRRHFRHRIRWWGWRWPQSIRQGQILALESQILALESKKP
jgi:hypothetical protein